VLRRTSAAAIVATVVGGWLVQTPAMADTPPAPPTGTSSSTPTNQAQLKPAVWPKPQSITYQGAFARVTPQVTLVADPDADPYAIDLVKNTLKSAGAQSIVTAQQPSPDGLTVYAGTTAAEQPLTALNAPPVGDLPSGGYRLAVSDRTIALAGVGDDGLFHAAQTLRQLATTQPATHDKGFAPATVKDWPTSLVRGTAESFYGVPWTQAQRLAQLDFLARTKQNRFLYAPGDDPYRQTQWREPYPAAQRADFRALAQRAKQDHVTLQWAVAPGQTLCYSSPDEQRALEKKLDAMWALGMRAFQLQFQDVSYSEWHCAADTSAFGSGPDAAARAQAQVANATAAYLQQKYGHTEDGAPELSLLPTEFYQDGATPYRTALADALDPGIEVAWTGVGVLPKQITGAQVAGAKAALRHPLLTVDNYPVNDFAPGRLFLGPYTGREPAVATVSAGLLASGMQQPAASRIPLFTTADYAWNPRGYDPQASWQAAIDDLAGTDPQARAALEALAGNEDSSALGGDESAYLQPLLKDFWSALADPGAPGTTGTATARTQLTASAEKLRAAFTVMRTAPGSLDGLADGTFGGEVRPWLDRLSAYGSAGEHAVDMLVAQAEGDGAAAWQARQALDKDRGVLTQGTAKVGEKALDGFLDQAVDESDAWTGLRADGRTATTTMASGRGTDPSAMVDGKDATAWSSDTAARPGDTFGVDLGASKPVGSVRITMGDGSGSDDFLHDAVLEVADDDGSGWRKVGTYHGQAVITATLPAGTRARQVRLRATAGQSGAVTVREFAVSVSGQAAPTASGGPHAAAAVDGDLSTPAGPGPLTVDFGGARLLDTVTVAAGRPTGHAAAPAEPPPGPPDSGWAVVPADPAPRTAPAPISVEVRVAGGGWHRIGSVRPGGWAELPAGVMADAVRLSDGDGVREVVPWFSGAPRVTVGRSEVGAEVGGPAVTVTADITSGLPRDTPVAVTSGSTGGADAPVQLAAPAGLVIRRGATGAVPLRISVRAGTAPGTYTVPVRFTVGGRTVERSLTVHTHPRTAGTDLVPGGQATSSGDETPDFPAAYVADGDPSTRWSSPVKDDAWVQVELAAPATVGKVVLHWEAAYAAGYQVQTSSDGVTWHTVAEVTDGSGGTESVWPDSPAPTRYLRVQGVRRATQYGYSLYGIQVYAVAG
jgi:hyaluronoglucosaminidase